MLAHAPLQGNGDEASSDANVVAGGGSHCQELESPALRRDVEIVNAAGTGRGKQQFD